MARNPEPVEILDIPEAASPDGSSASASGHPTLSAFECSVIDIFVRVADLLGAPRSIGEIYGFLYASARPLAFQDFVDRLEISKGSASQGLRFLRGAGAVKLVYVAGDRRDHFVPETELRALISGFLREKIQPQLEGGFVRLKSLQALVNTPSSGPGEVADRRVLRQRVDKLNAWHKRGKTIIPMIMKVLG
jgi:DNA-binding transcriptional regulator GbsR (MarR family)